MLAFSEPPAATAACLTNRAWWELVAGHLTFLNKLLQRRGAAATPAVCLFVCAAVCLSKRLVVFRLVSCLACCCCLGCRGLSSATCFTKIETVTNHYERNAFTLYGPERPRPLPFVRRRDATLVKTLLLFRLHRLLNSLSLSLRYSWRY